MLLNEKQTWLINECVGVILVSLDRFSFSALLLLVVSVVMLAVSLLDDVFNQNGHKLSVCHRKRRG